MSSEEIIVSLKLQSGEIFDGIQVQNLEWTLAEFVDRNLKILEVGHKWISLGTLVLVL